MKKHFLITIAYDGTNYCGWQRQKGDVVPTIEQKIAEACKKLFLKDVEIIGASRTDAGVHALGQRAVINVDTNIEPSRLPYAINTFLPKDIVVNNAEYVDENFHPRYNCIKKTYKYCIYNDDFINPLFRNYSEFIYKNLNVDDMIIAAKNFIGTYDFKAFCATSTSVKSTIRTIYSLDIKKNNNIIEIFVTGNGFLYNMVRIIAGTLIYVGLGKINPYDIKNIIESKDRAKAGKTSGASGLTLMNIYY